MKWYEKSFDRNTAIEFFQQLSAYTYEFVLNRDPHIAASWPIPNVGNMKCQPEGAIIHPSYSRYLWSSVKAATNPTSGIHFIVARKRHDRVDSIEHYPLVKDLPATVLSPHPHEEIIQHSGWISRITTGIELCNCDMLRADDSIVVHPSDYDPIRFAMNGRTKESDYKFFWAANGWREEFVDDVYMHGLHAYEIASAPQLESMVVILRALDEIYHLNPSLILPSSCVGETPTTFPYVNFDELRVAVKYRSDVDVYSFGATASSDSTYMEEDDVIDDDIDGITASNFHRNRWRTNTDDGHIHILRTFADKKFSFVDSKTKEYLKNAGYNSLDVNQSILVWALTNTTIPLHGMNEMEIDVRLKKTSR